MFFSDTVKYSDTLSILIPFNQSKVIFVYLKYSYTVSIQIPSVFEYRQYSNTVIFRIPSVFVHRILCFHDNCMSKETINRCWSLSPSFDGIRHFPK
uniref:Uncharacterized protein n=1 Tax=Brassica campestris TaxID=3711 RepID=A0A3P5Z9M1_BRACM|nr:unnamed protein product [Brassica rapa]